MALAALREGNGRLLLAETFVNELGDWSLMIAAAIWLQQLTGSVGVAGLVYVALLAPTFTSPLTGLLADRVPRRRVLLVTNAVMVPVVLSLLWVQSGSQAWLVVVVMAANGLAITLSQPARSALVASLFTGDLLGEVGGFTVGIQQSMRLLAPAVGAGAFVVLGPHAVVAGDAASFVIADLLLLSLSAVPTGLGQEADDTLGAGWAKAVGAGWRHIRLTPALAAGAVALVPAALVGGGIDTVGLAVTVRRLHESAPFFAWLTAGQGVGAIVAAFVVAAALRPLGELGLLGVGLAITGLGIAGWAVASVPVALTGSVVWGFGVTWVFAAAGLLPQRFSPGHLQGRTAAAMALLITGPQTIGALLASAFIDVVPVPLSVLTTAVVILLAGATLVRPMA